MFRRIITICFLIRFRLFPFLRKVCLRFSARGDRRLIRRIIRRLVLFGLLRALYRAIVNRNAARVAQIIGSVTTLRVTVRFVGRRTVQISFIRGGLVVAQLRIRAIRIRPRPC